MIKKISSRFFSGFSFQHQSTPKRRSLLLLLLIAAILLAGCVSDNGTTDRTSTGTERSAEQETGDFRNQRDLPDQTLFLSLNEYYQKSGFMLFTNDEWTTRFGETELLSDLISDNMSNLVISLRDEYSRLNTPFETGGAGAVVYPVRTETTYSQKTVEDVELIIAETVVEVCFFWIREHDSYSVSSTLILSEEFAVPLSDYLTLPGEKDLAIGVLNNNRTQIYQHLLTL